MVQSGRKSVCIEEYYQVYDLHFRSYTPITMGVYDPTEIKNDTFSYLKWSGVPKLGFRAAKMVKIGKITMYCIWINPVYCRILIFSHITPYRPHGGGWARKWHFQIHKMIRCPKIGSELQKWPKLAKYALSSLWLHFKSYTPPAEF